MTPRAILVAGFVAFVVYAYPGLMSPEAFAQLRDARAGESHDVLTAIWSVLDRIVVGPFPILVLQGGAFLAGAYLVARRVVAAREAAICASVALLFPPVLAGMAVVGSQGVFVGLMMLAAGLMTGPRAIAIALVVLATSIHCDGAIAAVFVLSLLAERIAGPWWKSIAIVVGVWLAAVLVAFGLASIAGESPTSPADATIGDVLGGPRVVTRAAQSSSELQAAEIQQSHGAVQRVSASLMAALADTFLFSPWFALVAAAVMGWFAPYARWLLASGIASLLVFAIDPRVLVYGDTLWLAATTWLTAALAIARSRSQRSTT